MFGTSVLSCQQRAYNIKLNQQKKHTKRIKPTNPAPFLAMRIEWKGNSWIKRRLFCVDLLARYASLFHVAAILGIDGFYENSWLFMQECQISCTIKILCVPSMDVHALWMPVDDYWHWFQCIFSAFAHRGYVLGAKTHSNFFRFLLKYLASLC